MRKTGDCWAVAEVCDLLGAILVISGLKKLLERSFHTQKKHNYIVLGTKKATKPTACLQHISKYKHDYHDCHVNLNVKLLVASMSGNLRSFAK